MDTNRLVAVVAGVVAAVVLLLVVVPPLLTGDDEGDAVDPTRPVTAVGGAGAADVPAVAGRALDPVSAAARPPAPSQWDGELGPVPSNTWWSSAVTGPGAISLWPEPLGLRIADDGTVEVAAPLGEVAADGSWEAPFVPAVFLDQREPATTQVVGHGPLHVGLRLATAGGAIVDLTLVQGSPLVELTTTDPVRLRVPGLDLADVPAAEVRTLRFGTSEGPWLVAAADPVALAVDGDVLTLTPRGRGRVVLGPEPTGAADDYATAARAVAARPLLGTEESIDVAADGTTTQVLRQLRGTPAPDGPGAIWALQPHHERYAVGWASTLGTVPGPRGRLPVVAGSDLTLRYPAVPVLWSAVPVPGGSAPVEDVGPLPVEGEDSYFGGKAAYGAAARGNALRAAGDDEGAAAADDEARRRLDQLLDPDTEPALRWEDRWGSVVVEPAAFGAGTELNDHQLQYGYWVAAAAHVAEVDPEAGDRYREAIDLLVADYAGTSAMPDVAGLPTQRTWSPYAGHSWASGTARFGAGNNLESISESNLAWWAAARWLIATGRAEEASVFIGRFTIETALVGDAWLPDGPQLPTSTTARPWSGVVWNAKSDLATWFDPQDESALGIRLLPVGPAGLARYATPAALDAADARWRWCEDRGGGCRTRWANLLDSDAAVAGRPLQVGPDPEPSTDPVLTAWWRDLWERTTPVDGWTCSVGAVARRHVDGSVSVLATNPGPAPSVLWCRDGAGTTRWSEPVRGTVVARILPSR